MTAQDLGWTDFFKEEYEKLAKAHWQPARLTGETVINYSALLHDGTEIDVVLSGKVWHEAETNADLPAVGDWVAVELGPTEDDENVIRARLPRTSRFSRKAPGKSSEEQVIATNVDYVVIVTDAGPDYNLRRLERYFTLVSKSGAKAIVLVNKSDLFPVEQNESAAAAIRDLNPKADVWITSAAEAQGLEVLQKYLTPGTTITLVGSSGVGKSTLANQLVGEEWLWTGEVNEVTGKGRHTTVARELIILPRGGILIDNPGIREVQMWTDEATLRESFRDIDELALQCKFRDCKHQGDAGCAIAKAVQDDSLDPARFEAYLTLDEEIAELEKRRKKRQTTIERRAKRSTKIKARNLNDRIQLEKDERGEI